MSEPLVVIGNGMAAARLVEELAKRALGRHAVAVVGDEPRLAYNRVLLSALLAEEVGFADIELKPARWWRDRGVTLRYGVRASAVDPIAREVTLSNGTRLSFSKLVFATGSQPMKLAIPGMDLPGVLTFRDIDDARTRRFRDGVDVVDVAEGEHARQVHSGDGELHRLRAGGKDEFGKRQPRAVRQRHFARDRIDRARAHAVAQGDAAVAPPSRRFELDIGEADLLGQERREQHAIVGKPRLVADHGDGVAAERAFGQFLDQTRRGHAIADDDERFAHRFPSKLRKVRAAAPSRAVLARREGGGSQSPSASMVTCRQPFQGACHSGPGGLSAYISMAWRWALDRGARPNALAAHCVRVALIVCARLCRVYGMLLAAHRRRIDVEIQMKARGDGGPWRTPRL